MAFCCYSKKKKKNLLLTFVNRCQSALIKEAFETISSIVNK